MISDTYPANRHKNILDGSYVISNCVMLLQLLLQLLWPFVRDYRGEPVPEETFTHLHLSWSSIILYQLPPSTAIHSILPVQFTVFLHNLCL